MVFREPAVVYGVSVLNMASSKTESCPTGCLAVSKPCGPVVCTCFKCTIGIVTAYTQANWRAVHLHAIRYLTPTFRNPYIAVLSFSWHNTGLAVFFVVTGLGKGRLRRQRPCLQLPLRTYIGTSFHIISPFPYKTWTCTKGKHWQDKAHFHTLPLTVPSAAHSQRTANAHRKGKKTSQQ